MSGAVAGGSESAGGEDAEDIVVDRAGPDATDWTLRVNPNGNGEVMATKTIPYDGVLTRSTEQRHYVSPRKSSTFNLSVEEVIAAYADATEGDVAALRDGVLDALRRDDVSRLAEAKIEALTGD